MQLEVARELGFVRWPKLKAHVERLSLEQPFSDDLDYYEGRADGVATPGGVSVAEARRDLARRHGFASWAALRRHVALVWAAKSDRVDALPMLVELGARVDADPYRGTALTWAAANGRVESVRTLVALGADPNRRGTFGGPDHGEGVTALHLAAQSGRREAVVALLELGADPLLRDDLHGGSALGWARFGGHEDLADVLPRPRADGPHTARTTILRSRFTWIEKGSE